MALTERSRGLTVAAALASRATADPGRAYLRHRDRIITYGQLEEQAEALAAALANLGIEAGDRVALILPPCPEFVIATFAAAKLGAIVVALNPRLTTTELQYMLRHSETACAVSIEEADGIDYLQLFEDLMPQLPELQYLVTVGDEDLWYDDRIFQFEDLISAGAGRDYAARGAEDAEATFALVYTSGTIGKPKGVELTHANLLASASGCAHAFGLVPEDRILGVSALFHVFGLAQGLLSTMLAGASLVLQDEVDPASTLDAIEQYRATVHFGIPSLFVAESRELGERSRDLSSLRLAVSAGAPAHDELLGRLETEFGCLVFNAYSITEAASTVAVPRTEDPVDKRRFTVGRPLPGMVVRIVDDSGSDLPVESVGEIVVRGDSVMRGYYRQPRETAGAIDGEGYLKTGDLGLVDEDGYLHLVGRIKDVIIRSGFNVYPREVETRIESHPAVHEVGVVGIPDALLGEAICACVVPVEGAIVSEREITEWCRETLAAQKVPDLVRFLDALPRTDTGKVRRVDLSRWLLSEGS